MVFFPLSFVLRGFQAAEYFMYASPKTLACPAIAPFQATADAASPSEKNPHL